MSGHVGNGPMKKRLYFGGDPDYRLDTGICFPDSSLLGDTKSGASSHHHTDSPDGGIDIATLHVKTRLGGAMH